MASSNAVHDCMSKGITQHLDTTGAYIFVEMRDEIVECASVCCSQGYIEAGEYSFLLKGELNGKKGMPRVFSPFQAPERLMAVSTALFHPVCFEKLVSITKYFSNIIPVTCGEMSTRKLTVEDTLDSNHLLDEGAVEVIGLWKSVNDASSKSLVCFAQEAMKCPSDRGRLFMANLVNHQSLGKTLANWVELGV